MYVTKATFYDYYSDSQVDDSSSPKAITDALDGSKITFSKFNEKIMNIAASAQEIAAQNDVISGLTGELQERMRQLI